ncbi:MAG: ABC transporter ATP-binding protein, partial [Rhodospirillales bacterium]|nr:ABC transporter ATP-binding protein [Rhodospirillales bacterium]
KNAALFGMIFVINRTIQAKLALFLQRLFVMYLNRSFRFHLQRNSAEIIRNLSTSANRAFESIRLMLMISLESMLALVAFALLLFFEPMVTVAAAAGLVSFGFLFHRLSGPHLLRWGKTSQDIDGRMIKSITEALGSIRDVKLLNVHEYLGSEFAHHTKGRARILSKLTTFQHLPRLSVETLVIMGFAAVVLSLMFTKHSTDEVISALGLLGIAALRLMPSTSRILTGANDLKNRLANVDVLYQDLMDAEAEATQPDGNGPHKDFSLSDEIRFTDVSFSYPGGVDAAVKALNIAIKTGESVGIVGTSGAGKSTFIDLLLGLLPPDTGSISVDGRDIALNTRGWQEILGYVPQSIYLVDDTIRRNIAFGLNDEAIDPARINFSLRMANLESVIEGLPNGLETRLHEGGSRLSGGQRQRVAIARALYRDPEVLIFDEATSDLDNETEKEVTAAIDRLKGEKTVITISHKLSTVRNCDKIIYMIDGEINDIGSFDALCANNSRFRQFADSEPKNENFTSLPLGPT